MLRTKIHIAISAIGAVFGISAFICFCIVFANIEAGMWALLSGEYLAFVTPLGTFFLIITENRYLKYLIIVKTSLSCKGCSPEYLP